MLHLKDESCVHLDKHMLSIRQRSSAILSVVGKGAVATSASTVFHKRQKFTLTALEKCEAALNTAEARQLCYYGRVVSKDGRYIFLVKVLVPIKPSSQSMLWLLNLFFKNIVCYWRSYICNHCRANLWRLYKQDCMCCGKYYSSCRYWKEFRGKCPHKKLLSRNDRTRY